MVVLELNNFFEMYTLTVCFGISISECHLLIVFGKYFMFFFGLGGRGGGWKEERVGVEI